MDKKIEPTDAIVDDIALYLGREHLVPRTPGVITYPPRADTMDAWRIVSAVLSHPDAAGLFADEDARPWEPLGESDPARVGDEVKWDYYGLTMTATVARVDKTGSLYTAAGLHVGVRSVGTWHVRRVAPELPTKCGTVIVANDGHKFIKAEVDGIAHRAREAVLGANGWWYGAWRKAEGDGLLSAMFPEHISAPTWKVDEK